MPIDIELQKRTGQSTCSFLQTNQQVNGGQIDIKLQNNWLQHQQGSRFDTDLICKKEGPHAAERSKSSAAQ